MRIELIFPAFVILTAAALFGVSANEKKPEVKPIIVTVKSLSFEPKKLEIHVDPEGNNTTYERSTTQLPAEPQEIKPHPYGIELGQLFTMLKDTTAGTMAQFLTESFSRVSPGP